MTSADSTRVLMVEDDPVMAGVFRKYLAGHPYDVTHVDSGAAALSALCDMAPDIVLLDLLLPDMNGFDILKRVSSAEMPTAVVVMTSDASMNRAIEAMRLGAQDFLVKPFNRDRLLTTLANMSERQRLSRIVQAYRDEIDRGEYCGFIGSSTMMQGVYRIIDSAANSKATVFITGESGTGKEVCADAIHRRSGRAKKPFIALNCGAIPKDLIESEIFGHAKGAFTGAQSDRDGAAKQADSGVLFLDEICEMELSLQTKLLRFIQTGTFQKVGGSRVETVDARFICATNRDPMAEVQAGRFREDLYYRLHVLPIHLPPLRDREGDVVDVARSFLKAYAREEGKEFTRFAPETEAVFDAYDWPGNVRQFQNVVRNIVVLNQGDTVTPDMLPPPLDAISQTGGLRRPVPSPPVAPAPVATEPVASSITPPAERRLSPDDVRPLEEIEREAIRQAIDACGGNIPQAAYLLGISTATIYRKRNVWKKGAAGV